MKIAITGGTGFIGKHLANDLAGRGHQVVVVSRGLYTRGEDVSSHRNMDYVNADINDTAALRQALTGCEAVAHLAGTSTESAGQSFEHVHVDGARSTVTAAKQAGVKKLVLVSYLHVRPDIDSPYHTSKWQGEQIVKESGLKYTIIKAGLVYGAGDHMLHNLGGILRRLPLFATVGLREKTVRPIAVEDLVAVIRTALLEERLVDQTVAVVGPDEFPMSTAARRISKTLGKPFLLVVPAPVFAQRLLALVSSRMPKPLISPAQVQMLADGASEPLPDSRPLPEDLAPKTHFTDEQIRKGLPGQ